MCRANIHGHTDSKCFLQSSIYEVVIQEWTFTISLPKFFIQWSFLLFYLKCFFGNAIRTPFGYNLSCWKKEYKNKNSKICDFLSEMPLDECSTAMGFQVKEIKRQSRAVKVTHPPAERRQLHKRMKWAASQVQWSDSVMKRLHKQGFLEFVKMWRKPPVLSEERLLPREEKSCDFVPPKIQAA